MAFGLRESCETHIRMGTHFLISLVNHSSLGWKPKKALPSPPKSQGFMTSKDFRGRREES